MIASGVDNPKFSDRYRRFRRLLQLLVYHLDMTAVRRRRLKYSLFLVCVHKKTNGKDTHNKRRFIRVNKKLPVFGNRWEVAIPSIE